jgi:hypothetical protein
MDRSTPTDGKPLGYGIDESPQTRPGVPRERLAGDPDAHWKHPEQQRGVELLSASGLRAATPVFGTAQPVRGLSGAVRRAAYRVPEQRTARWLLLVAADRIDVVEHRLARVLWLLPAAAALAVGYLAVSRALARR